MKYVASDPTRGLENRVRSRRRSRTTCGRSVDQQELASGQELEFLRAAMSADSSIYDALSGAHGANTQHIV